jgi:hypothetical protein
VGVTVARLRIRCERLLDAARAWEVGGQRDLARRLRGFAEQCFREEAAAFARSFCRAPRADGP